MSYVVQRHELTLDSSGSWGTESRVVQVNLPRNSVPLSVKHDQFGKKLHLFVGLPATAGGIVRRRFLVAPEGHPISEAIDSLRLIGTFEFGDWDVVHVFELGAKP